jgi:MFS transporter, FHS family, L-fucose permease
VFGLAFIFFISRIPEITDADMEFQAAETHAGSSDKPFRKQYRLFHAAIAQFTYTGAQVAIAAYFINYVTETRPGTSDAAGSKFYAGAQGCFAVGRFSGSLFMRFVKPRWIFLIYMCGVIAFLAPAITQGGNTGLSMLMITLFFESVCFPTIVALGIRGLGRHTKRGSGVIIAGVSGGAASMLGPLHYFEKTLLTICDSPRYPGSCGRPKGNWVCHDCSTLLHGSSMDVCGVRQFRPRLP